MTSIQPENTLEELLEKIVNTSLQQTAERDPVLVKSKTGAFAEEKIIDYISCGPVFSTKTKKDARTVVGLERLRETVEKTTLPLVAIGGITEENLPAVMATGPQAVAVISELLQAPDIGAKTRRLTDIINQSS